ncbi:MAG: 5'-deoxyadenosine deaminase [Gemmatimonadetes bacterium]|nr:5'-deoxyadenosine deaminase [Gemmatimonadota bacterium]
MPESILFRNALLVTMDAGRRVIRGDLYLADGRIGAVGTGAPAAADLVVDASHLALLPGLVQTHVHLCQTGFRGQADDLELLEWLRLRVWPLEAAHDPETLAASARLGCAELILGGTTTVVDMGTVHHTEEIFRALRDSGLRAFAGKCMMDEGDEVPPGLRERTDASLRESLDLLERWDGAEGGRIHYCFAPRFALTSSDALLREVARSARERGVLVHTHASESRAECALVQSRRGASNIAYLHRLGLTESRLLLAHCVHLAAGEMEILARTRTGVAHCPSSNLKLGSGIARVAELRRAGVEVGIGADGAPCNNTLDAFLEMRLAALLQSTVAGPGALTAADVLEMATLGGARLLRLEQEIGSLEVGKRADVIAVDLTGPHCQPAEDDDAAGVASRLVYAARAADVRWTLVDGRVLLRDRELATLEREPTLAEARRALGQLKRRAFSVHG